LIGRRLRQHHVVGVEIRFAHLDDAIGPDPSAAKRRHHGDGEALQPSPRTQNVREE